jgi:hypothetical protein
MQTGMAEEQIQAVAVPSPEGSADRVRELLEVHTHFKNVVKITEIKEIQHFSKWGYKITGDIIAANSMFKQQTWYIVDMDDKDEVCYHLNMIVGPGRIEYYTRLIQQFVGSPESALGNYESARATLNRLFTENLASDEDVAWADHITDPHYGAKYLIVMRSPWW